MSEKSPVFRGTALLIIITVVAAGLGGGAVSAQIPQLPANYYGNLSIVDGEVNQPVRIEVVTGGEVVKNFTTKKDGSFGKIEVQPPDESETWDIVEFHIGGELVDQVPFEGGTQEIEIVAQAEDIEPNLNLTIDSTNAPIQAGEDLEVSVALENAGPARAVRTVELSGFDDTIVASQELAVGIGNTSNTTLIWETTSENSGTETITVQYGNLSATEEITIEPPEQTQNGTGSGGGAGGAGGGSGTGGSSPAQQGPPSIAEIRDTLKLVSSTTTEPTVGDTAPDTPGMTVIPNGAQIVNSIVFNAQGLNGSVQITEYPTPAQEIREQVRQSILGAGIAGFGGENATGNVTLDVISVVDISPTTEQAEDTAATVTLSVPKSEVENPQQLTVIKETYDFEAQETTWTRLETTVQQTDGDRVTVSAQADQFSLFAVTEVTGQTGSTDSNQGSGTDSTNSPGISAIVGIGIVALLIIAIAIYRNQ